MPMIYCAFDMFAFGQSVRIVEDDGTSTVIYTATQDVADTIANLCKEKNITNIRLYGNKDYLGQIVTDITTNYNLHYHCGNPLNIEVN